MKALSAHRVPTTCPKMRAKGFFSRYSVYKQYHIQYARAFVRVSIPANGFVPVVLQFVIYMK